MARILTCLWVLLFLNLSCSCRGKNEQKGTLGEASTQRAADSPVTVSPIDKMGLMRLVSQRNGKTLLLNIWATWCVPCVEEIPDLVKISHSYDTNDVEVVAISADYPDEVNTKIIPFLRKTKVPFRVYVAQFEHQEDFINAVDSSWSGALPATLLYDLHGRKRFFHVGGQSFEEFKQEVDKTKREQ